MVTGITCPQGETLDHATLWGQAAFPLPPPYPIIIITGLTVTMTIVSQAPTFP